MHWVSYSIVNSFMLSLSQEEFWQQMLARPWGYKDNRKTLGSSQATENRIDVTTWITHFFFFPGICSFLTNFQWKKIQETHSGNLPDDLYSFLNWDWKESLSISLIELIRDCYWRNFFVSLRNRRFLPLFLPLH